MSDRAAPRDVRTLWLLRHAKTVTDPPRGGSDYDRVLAPRGRRDATALGRLLGGAGSRDGRASEALAGAPLPDVVLASSAVRTTATARLVLDQLSDPPELRLLDELYGDDPEDVVALLRTLPDQAAGAMVVGHNPTAHALALHLLSPDDGAGPSRGVKGGFPTCALGVYRFATDRWSDVRLQSATLVALLRPPY
jgi:phosphohistidine phosphatase